MYVIDFFKRMFRKSNVPIIIYFLLNIIIIFMIFATTFAASGLPISLALISGLFFYLISVAISLSSFGEWLLRWQTGCKVIRDQAVLDYIYPLFTEVYEKARMKDPSISPDVKLYMNADECPNAFATGRKTVCVTKGMMKMPPELIKATLGHEFGHLAHKDTDLLLVINVGNFIITGIIISVRIGIEIGSLITTIIGIFMGGKNGFFMIIMSFIMKIITSITIALLSRVWSWIGILLCMKSSRENEFQADSFSVELGYGQSLIELMNFFGGGKPEGLFATLSSSHPPMDDRIAHIKEVMAEMEAQGRAYGISSQNTYSQTPYRVPEEIEAIPGRMQPYRVPAGMTGFNAQRQDPREETVRITVAGQKQQTSFTPKFCPKCGEMVEDVNACFCSECGTQFSKATVCPECGESIESVNARFCSGCGTQFSKPNFCPECGQKVENANARFCGGCGNKFPTFLG